MPDPVKTSRSDRPVLIVGGGVAGLALGWRLLHAGRAVHLFERDRAGRGASWASAGMLAPDAEIGFEDPELYRLNRESLRRWPAFAAALETESGIGDRDSGPTGPCMWLPTGMRRKRSAAATIS